MAVYVSEAGLLRGPDKAGAVLQELWFLGQINPGRIGLPGRGPGAPRSQVKQNQFQVLLAPVQAVKSGFLLPAGPENPGHVDILLRSQVEPTGLAPADRNQTQPQVAVPFAYLGIPHRSNLWIMGQFIHQGIDPQVSLVEL